MCDGACIVPKGIIIKKIYIDAPQQLSKEIEQIDQKISDNAAQLKQAKSDLENLEAQKVLIENKKAHIEIRKYTEIEIPDLESSIDKLNQEIQIFLATLPESKSISNKLSEEGRKISRNKSEYKIALDAHNRSINEHLSKLEAAGEKIYQLIRELDKLKSTPISVPLVTVTNYSGKTETKPDYSQQIKAIARLEEIEKELAKAEKDRDNSAAQIEKLKKTTYSHHSSSQTLTIDDLNREMKLLEEQEENVLTKRDSARSNVEQLESKISAIEQSIEKQKEQLHQKKVQVETLVSKHGKPTAEDLKADDLEAQIDSLNEKILATQNKVALLEAPVHEREEKKSFHNKLIHNKVYNQLVNNPIELLRELTIKAKKLSEKYNNIYSKAEFQRSIDEISAEDDLLKDQAPNLEAREKCFQICGLMNYMTESESSIYGLDRGECEESYKNFLQRLNPDNPTYLSLIDTAQIKQNLLAEALMNFRKALKPYAPAINRHEQTKKLYKQINAMETIGTLPDDDLEFCAQVLRVATLRIRYPANKKYETELNVLAKQIKHEQSSATLKGLGKGIAIVGAIILLASLIAISVLTFGAALPATLPIVAYTGSAVGALGLFSGYAMNKKGQATGSTKKIIDANDAVTQINALDSLAAKKIMAEKTIQYKASVAAEKTTEKDEEKTPPPP